MFDSGVSGRGEIPSLSVIIPAHNEEALIARTLLSATARVREYPAETEIIVSCNGCTDRTAAIARLYPVTVIEDARSGMSFGKNLGAGAAKGDLFFFWDADTLLEEGAFADLEAAVRGRRVVAGGVYTLPDKVYPRSSIFYWIMNCFCRVRRIPPAGTVLISRSTFREIGGFDESIPQGTSSDLVRRGKEAGAEFVMVQTKKCRTSVRRFEKRGYLRQILEWRRNIHFHSNDRKECLVRHDYDTIR